MRKPLDDDQFELVHVYNAVEGEDRYCIIAELRRMLEEAVLNGKIIRLEVKKRRELIPNFAHASL